MENGEKEKVILDYDKYQELLKRVNEADKNIVAQAIARADKAEAKALDTLNGIY